MYTHERNSEKFTIWLPDQVEFERMLASYLSLCSIGIAAPDAAGELSTDLLQFTIGIKLNEDVDRSTHFCEAVIEGAILVDRKVDGVIVSLMHPLQTDLAIYLLIKHSAEFGWQINPRIETEQIEDDPSSPFGPFPHQGHFLDEPIIQQLLHFLG